MYEALALGLALGSVSALHCIAMCGPLNAFVAVGPDGATDPWRVVRYQLGRVLGYASVGAVLGAIGGSIADLLPPASEVILSVALGLALALAAAQLWIRALPRTGAPLVVLRKTPRSPTWLERVSRRLGALLISVRRAPTLLGILSALLPCGVLASGALLAASTGHAVTGAIAMLGFAIASGVVVGLVGVGLGRVRPAESRFLSRAMAATLALGAIILFVRPVLTESHGQVCHHPAP